MYATTTKQRSKRSYRVLQLLITLSVQQLYKSSVSPLDHKTCVQVLDSWQDFVDVLLVNGHHFRGPEPAYRSCRMYGLPHFRKFQRNGPRKWQVVLWCVRYNND